MHVDFSNLKLNIGDEAIDRIGTDCKDNYFKLNKITSGIQDEHTKVSISNRNFSNDNDNKA